MKFTKYGTYQPKAIDFPSEEVQPLEFVQLSHFPRLDYLIGVVDEMKPELTTKYIEALKGGYASLIKKNYTDKYLPLLKEIFSKYKYLKENHELALNILNYYLQLIGVTNKIDWTKERIKITDRNFLQSFLRPRYHNVSFLASVVGKEEAIKLYKYYRTTYAIETTKEYNNKMKDVEHFYEENFKGVREEKYPGTVVVLGTPENGKMYYRKDTCFWARSIEDLPDKDFRYLAACYSDFEGTKTHWNQDFILTMDHTIAKGDPYCSCVIHDTRVDWNIQHPDEDFWDNISPLGEWQQKQGKKSERRFQQDFQQLGHYAPEVLDELHEITPLEIIEKSSFNRLDYLLGFIKKHKPQKFDDFVKNLEINYAQMSKIDYYNQRNSEFDIQDLLNDFKNLEYYKQLAIHSLNYFLGLLEIPKDTDWTKEKIKILRGNFFRSFLIPRYQNVKILADTIPREEAVRLYKIYRAEHAKIFTAENQRNRFETLENLRQDDFDDYEKEGGNPGWVRIEGIVENGKFVYRKDSCLYAEAMKDYPDGEFKHLAACYYDFEGTRLQWNKHFVLTMEHTIAEGDPYCSCVVHDTRIDWDLTHPPEEYWNSIWPLQEWQKKRKKENEMD